MNASTTKTTKVSSEVSQNASVKKQTSAKEPKADKTANGAARSSPNPKKASPLPNENSKLGSRAIPAGGKKVHNASNVSFSAEESFAQAQTDNTILSTSRASSPSTRERYMTPTAIQKDPKKANNWKSVPVEQLTDQDVLSMPDSEYMNDVQLAFFRRKLVLLKDDMLANAGETTEHLREDTVVVPDPADRATIEEEHALELRTRDRERKLLKKIEQAIARIDAGDYGYCDETGEPIGVGRLMARPTASLSLEAQQRRELKQKMFGD